MTSCACSMGPTIPQKLCYSFLWGGLLITKWNRVQTARWELWKMCKSVPGTVGIRVASLAQVPAWPASQRQLLSGMLLLGNGIWNGIPINYGLIYGFQVIMVRR